MDCIYIRGKFCLMRSEFIAFDINSGTLYAKNGILLHVEQQDRANVEDQILRTSNPEVVPEPLNPFRKGSLVYANPPPQPSAPPPQLKSHVTPIPA